MPLSRRFWITWSPSIRKCRFDGDTWLYGNNILQIYHGKTVAVMFLRWKKLDGGFAVFVLRCVLHGPDLYDEENDSFNISKIPDIYDSIKYDVLHNSEIPGIIPFVRSVQA
jgi:hypothetical protein